jgi:hypothetical protein
MSSSQPFHLKENFGKWVVLESDSLLNRMGHNTRQKCIEFIQSKNENRNWKDVKIMVFDAPQSTDKPYSQRLSILQSSKSHVKYFNILQIFLKVIQYYLWWIQLHAKMLNIWTHSSTNSVKINQKKEDQKELCWETQMLGTFRLTLFSLKRYYTIWCISLR